MSGVLGRALRLVPALWAGMLLTVALVATPAPFAVLAVAEAGRVVARILAQEAWTSLVLALALLAVERRRAQDAAQAGTGSVLSVEMLLLFGAIACTVAGYFGVQPLLPAARAGQGSLSFGQLHLISTVCYGVKTLLVLALAWRRTGAA